MGDVRCATKHVNAPLTSIEKLSMEFAGIANLSSAPNKVADHFSIPKRLCNFYILSCLR